MHVTSYQVPGYGYEEIQLARVQRQLGHQVWILTSNFLHPPGIFYGVLRERFPERQVAPREELVDGVTIIRLKAIELERRVWIRGLERRLRQIRPDIVHAHNLLQFNSVRAALMRATGRASFGLLIDDHMLYSVVRSDRVGRLIYLGYRNLLGPVVARNVDRFTAATAESRRYLQEECGVRADIPIMPLGVDVDLFRPSQERRESWRRRLGIGAEAVVVLYTGKIIASKRLELLVSAAQRLLSEGAPIEVLMVGDADPEYQEKVRSEIKTPGEAERIRFLPSLAQQDLAGLYAAADLAVWPGTESMAIFEALSAGLPVIVADKSAYAPLVKAGTGLIFGADDGSLAAAIRTLLDSETRKAIGAYGRSLASRDYSWRRAAGRYLSTYMDICRERGRR